MQQYLVQTTQIYYPSCVTTNRLSISLGLLGLVAQAVSMIYRKWPKIFFLFIHHIHSKCPQDGNISKHQSDARPDGMLKHFNAELIVPKSTHQIIHTNRFFILRPFQRNVESALHISKEFLSCWHFSSASAGLY